MAFITPLAVTSSLIPAQKAVTSRKSRFTVSRATPTRVATSTWTEIRASDGTAGVMEQKAWVDAIPISEIKVGTLKSVIISGLDICLACDYDGQVYALGNKGPPLGLPLSDGSIVADGDGTYLQCAQNGSLFNLRDGTVRPDTWIRSPPLVSNFLRLIFKEPGAVPVYEIRDSGDMLQIYVNINARAQYEQKYWKGILDASGKADGGYY